MNVKEVKELLQQFDQSTLTEFDLREGSFELYMNKNKTSQRSDTTTVVNETAPFEKESEVSLPKESIEESMSEKTQTQVAIENSVEIVSPIVGVVYLKPAPDQAAFKQIGDSVKAGEVICIVEAMKLMNEITATTDGTISEILVNNEDVVEFNQPLFKVTKGG